MNAAQSYKRRLNRVRELYIADIHALLRDKYGNPVKRGLVTKKEVNGRLNTLRVIVSDIDHYLKRATHG